jgi:hypothetical protein
MNEKKKQTCFKTHADKVDNLLMRSPRNSFEKWAYWCKTFQSFHSTPCEHLAERKSKYPKSKVGNQLRKIANEFDKLRFIVDQLGGGD